ncbi:hypothetical protein CK203_022243 [Vitis vinifera]|uniref:Uncharacterized protein n=1 Tax=Vitis vinifera TaxID=29760 RepID=A0A438I9G0_VITVI|nr:hypothetical protein CK203_022243 [Vitis vinifera]
MQVSTSGFPQLEVLQLSSLGNWKRLIIEKGGMSKLTHLQIFESVLDMMDLLSSSICRRQISLIHIHIILAGFLPCLGAPNWRYAERTPEFGLRRWHLMRVGVTSSSTRRSYNEYTDSVFYYIWK